MKKRKEEYRDEYSPKVYFITGGATGGHIYPALAVANELRKQTSTKKVYYTGHPENLEYEIFTRAGFEFLPVKVSAMPRKIDFEFVKCLAQLFAAVMQTIGYIIKYKPNAIFMTGGYVSAPAVVAANILKTPYMMHDSDAYPGIVSKKSAKNAKVVSIAFEEAKNHLASKRIILNGNPIRESFSTITKNEAKKILGIKNKTTLLIMGGSQGAQSVNDVICDIMPNLIEYYGLQVIFQTGAKNYEKALGYLETNHAKFKKWIEKRNLIIEPYFDEMSIPLRAADLAISRAGALSISEMNLCGLPSILVPYPHAAADHQTKNALAMQEEGAAICIADDEKLKENLTKTIDMLAYKPELLKTMKAHALSLAKYDATAKITQQLIGIAK